MVYGEYNYHLGYITGCVIIIWGIRIPSYVGIVISEFLGGVHLLPKKGFYTLAPRSIPRGGLPKKRANWFQMFLMDLEMVQEGLLCNFVIYIFLSIGGYMAMQQGLVYYTYHVLNVGALYGYT